MADNKNKIPFRQLFLQYSNTALNIIFPLILFPYMTRTLGPAGYGIIGFYESMMQVVNVWAAFGVSYFGLRLLSKSYIGDTGHANTVLHLLLINTIMAFSGVLIYLVYVYNKPVQIGTVQITWLYAFIMMMYNFHADWYFQSQEKYRFLLQRTFYLRLFVLATSLIFIHRPEHLIYYIIISSINYALIATSAWWNMRDLLPHWKWDPGMFRKLLVALWPFALMGVLGSLYFSLDTILLARYGKVTELGHYTVAVKIVRLGLNVFIGASIVFFVKLFRSKVNRGLQTESMLMTMHLSIPIGAMLCFFAGPVIRFVSGEHYLPAIDLLRIFSLLWVVVPLHDFFNIQVLMVHHKEKWLVGMYLGACMVSFLLNLLLIPYFFTTGAAWAILITETAVLVASVWLSRNYFRINRRVMVDFFSCLICFPIAYGAAKYTAQFTQKAWAELFIGLSATVLIYSLFQLFILKNPFWNKIITILTARWSRPPR